MQLRSGKVVNINSSVISEKHEVSIEVTKYIEWFSKYVHVMSNKLCELVDNSKKDILMDKLRICYEIFYNTNEFLQFTAENWDEYYNWKPYEARELLRILKEKCALFQTQFETSIKNNIWYAEEIWTIDDLNYVHCVLDEMKRCSLTCTEHQLRINK